MSVKLWSVCVEDNRVNLDLLRKNVDKLYESYRERWNILKSS